MVWTDTQRVAAHGRRCGKPPPTASRRRGTDTRVLDFGLHARLCKEAVRVHQERNAASDGVKMAERADCAMARARSA